MDEGAAAAAGGARKWGFGERREEEEGRMGFEKAEDDSLMIDGGLKAADRG